ncbi:tRNA epoxyqueuosine(34) reductase QueG [Psychromonas sp. 14N.309.X.WAT.B.A12]|uniref:tRNA epoxyqueuosine(34) reductase QueG n=1 Tax=unclassified Psychromonas TaxID=2614957 RepID=UPI0025B190A8|nr:tRNA epoxyqueuosine(34) reductase QueG [Psychromonas sp. 14N.309.X.WAT.B.A12]MDN2664185.1 tRNA epoxyqueuosine(34) reductase QueG [Psychromonas sp. 14N.309.X.WAT.B.A12]
MTKNQKSEVLQTDPKTPLSSTALSALAENIKAWGKALGFQAVGISDVDLKDQEANLQAWLDNQYHGEMDYMEKHGMMRARPDELLPGTLRVISVRMDYLPDDAQFAANLEDKDLAYISRYALGRDYHKVLRKRLKQLGDKIKNEVGELGFRPFVDSAPILERPLAEKAGLGWVGKHSLLLDKDSGSWFFLGELLIDLALPVDQAQQNQCGQCVACIKICPTQAIVAPYVVDGRRCISYLTIELQGAIPSEFRKAIGNRIYGCDDCQLICPWNRFAETTQESDYQAKDFLQNQSLLSLFAWSETTFLKNTEGSPIRRIGYQRWLRNIAVALGNAPSSIDVITSLQNKLTESEDELVNEHIEWALTEQQQKLPINIDRLNQRLIKAVKKGLPRDA